MPKWGPRSRLGIYLGHSPCHAGSVALVLNPKTLNVSPQYYIVFDDHLTTIPFLSKGQVPPNWKELVDSCSEHATDSDFDKAFEMAQEEITDDDTPDLEGVVPANDIDSITPNTDSISDVNPLEMPTVSNLYELTLRRSARIRERNERDRSSVNTTFTKKIFGLFTMFCLVTTTIYSFQQTPTPNSSLQKAINHCHMVNSHFDGTLNHLHHLILSSEATNETFTFKDAMKQEDYRLFIDAMLKEVEDHEERDHWTLLKRKACHPVQKLLCRFGLSSERDFLMAP